MTLTSQVLITANFEQAILELEAQRTTETIIKIMEDEKAFSVDDAKLVIEKAYLASEEMTVIILAAKTFSPIVQNKLLKVIEEPPKNKSFILLTQSKATILDTIRSRMPIVIRTEEREEEALGLVLSQLSLATVYEFIQEHKRTDAKAMKVIVAQLSTQAMASGQYNLDTNSLTLFSDSLVALDMGSPPAFILNGLLLKLLARKKR